MPEYDLDAAPKQLLTLGNPKTDKSLKYGYSTAILHLAPHKLAAVGNLCGYASAGCAAACLNTAGRGGIALDSDGLNGVQVARIQRTRLWKRDPESFYARLTHEIQLHVDRARRAGLTPCVRLNGTSDLPWEKLRPQLFERFADIQFYDYTKWPLHKRGKAGALPTNYHLTFSLCEDNDARAIAALDSGVNVAAVLAVKRGATLPQSFALVTDGRIACRQVVDGDAHDLRFLDPADSFVALRAKGRAITDRSGFVRAA